MFRTGFVALVSLSLLAFPMPTLGELPADRPVAGIEIIADEAWTARIEWAMSRYEAAGLELPSAIIQVHSEKASCGGNSGLYRPAPVPEVHLCVADPDSKVGRLIALHELGHLWAENRLDQATIDGFLTMRGLADWTNNDVPPHEWGAEHAAEVLSWGLMDEPVRIVRIYDASPEALTAAFEVLTGTTPLVAAGA